MPPEGFYVGGIEGPLLEGELERAVDWGALLENNMQARITIYDVEGNEYTKFKIRLYNPKWGDYEKMSS